MWRRSRPCLYELLDAHADTAQLAGDGPVATEAEWENHLAYLRDLQRVARETLAHAMAFDGRSPPRVARSTAIAPASRE